jgi:hypothetical protein
LRAEAVFGNMGKRPPLRGGDGQERSCARCLEISRNRTCEIYLGIAVALWSMFVEVGESRYSTQITAPDPSAAIAALLESGGLIQTLAGLSKDGWPERFAADDIVLFIPMDGLVNMHLCQIGREGKYITVTFARTVEDAST